MTNTKNPDVQARKRYLLELGLSMTGYVAVIYFSRLWGQRLGGFARVAIALAPTIPTAFVFAAIVRVVRSIDELQRQIVVQSLALAGGATALLSLTYGLLEGDALPRPSAWWTYAAFMASWVVASCVVRLRFQ